MAEQQYKQALATQDQDIEEKVIKPKKWWRWCCGIPAIICVLIFIALIIFVFIIEKKQADRMSNRNKPETYSEIFNINILPDYTVSETDEKEFNKKIVILFQKNDSEIGNYTENGDTKLLPLLNKDKKLAKAISDMKFLKDYYPEGYYLVVNSVLKTPEKEQQFPNFYRHSTGEVDRVNFLVHELSHLSIIVNALGCDDFGYLVEDKFVNFNKLTNAPKGDELLKYISELTALDNKYLKESKHNIYATLDEIVAYTKSVRLYRAFAYKNKVTIDEDAPQGLSRQLYYLSLHLKNIKENHPAFWENLKKEKGFAYIVSREVTIVKTEIKAAKDEGVWSSTNTDFAGSIDNNLLSFDQNQSVLDELFDAAGLDSMNNLQNLTEQKLMILGLKIKKF
ncbi:MAG: hypothetical protein WCW17_01710 [Patescibacteria group bacterium]|jgi:hypothetical protein